MNSLDLYTIAYNAQFKEKNLSKAMQAYQQLVEQFPNSMEAGYAREQLQVLKSREDDPSVLFEKAQLAWKQGDERAVGVLIDRILKQDFLHRDVWEHLHLRHGAGKPFEVFQRVFAEKYYPDKAYLLSQASLMGTSEQTYSQFDSSDIPSNGTTQHPTPDRLRRLPGPMAGVGLLLFGIFLLFGAFVGMGGGYNDNLWYLVGFGCVIVGLIALFRQ